MSTDMSLQALHGILFEEIDRLNDTDLTEDELKAEIDRADAMEGIANTIVKNANTMMKAAVMSRFGSAAGKEARFLIERHEKNIERVEEPHDEEV